MSAKDELIAGLNEDLANEYQAIILYTTYAATVSGPYRESMKEFFAAELPEEQRHAQLLANKIAAMGGTPTTRAAAVPEARDLRSMLQNVAKSEADTVDRYSKRMQQAEDYGDFGLANDIQTIISDETQHKEEAEMLLRGL